MNQGMYKLVYSKVLNMLVPASEAVRSHGAKGGSRRVRKHVKSQFFLLFFIYSAAALAEPAGLIPGTQAWRNAVISSVTGNSMTITQTAPKAILDWRKLNLNKDELLRFNQQGNRTWSALNRIHDLSPSIINGMVQADGNVYFINANGIIFGQNAQFNVGSLYAGTLDISDDLFNEGILSKPFEPVFQGLGGFVTVESGAQLNTISGGKVMLFAPTVTNNGIINTPDGQTILAAGKKVYLQSSSDPAGFLVEVDSGGTATNLGKIVAERGNITMMGLAVNQAGKLTATTSVRANGSIRLLAQDGVTQPGLTLPPLGKRNGLVTLAKDSVTEVKPEIDNKEETIVSQPFKTSDIFIEASLVNIDGKVSAKGGNVKVETLLSDASAELNSQNARRIYLGDNAEIDVSGVDAIVPMSRNQLEIQLFSDQLKDAPILRGGGLFRDTVYVDARKGTELLDIKPFLDLKGATVAEKMTKAGKVTFSNPNEVIVSKGAIINVSGGSTTYQAGTIKETNLFYNGKSIPISQAKPDVPYERTGDIYTVKSNKWGVTLGWDLLGGTESYRDIVPGNAVNAFKTAVVGSFVNPYFEGDDAGTVDFTVAGDNSFTQNVFIAGPLLANTRVGIEQQINQQIPRGGELLLSANNLEINNVVSENYTFDAALPDAANFVSKISSDFAEQGFNHIDFTKVQKLAINDNLELKPNGDLKLGVTTQINANIIAPSTDIKLGLNTTIADNVTVSTAGKFTNDSAGVTDQYSKLTALDGGSIKGGETSIVSLGKNIKLDTSAGAWVDNGGLLHQGKAGDIGISVIGKFDESVKLQAYGFDKNGSLNINFDQQNINIAGNANARATDVDINLDFFNSGAFSNYSLSALNINVGEKGVASQEIYATQKNWVLNPLFNNFASDQAMSAVATPVAKPALARNATLLSLSAFKEGGVLNLAENTTLKTDIGGNVSLSAGKQVSVLGDITAPSGNINIRINDNDPDFNNDLNNGVISRSQGVFIGENATLSATGASLTFPDSQPSLLKNRIYNAGSININQPETATALQKGAVVIKNGAVLDVSGVSVANDLKTPNGFVRETLDGDAGKITITSSDGGTTFLDSMLLDGTFKGAASGAGRDGTLELVSSASEFNITQQKQLRADSYGVGENLAVSDDVAQISTEQIQQGGFANVKVKSFVTANDSNSIQLAGDVDLKLAGNLKLETSQIRVKDNGNAQLSGSHVTLKSPNISVDSSTLATGSGTLSVNAKQIYFDGLTAISGVSKTSLIATQDITGRGNQIRNSGLSAIAGGLVAPGEINLAARQIYPNTTAKLGFEALGDNSKININSSGATAKPVLAAGGELSLKADDIVQNGVLKAPFGKVNIDAKNSATFTANSSTSVSAENQIIPFSITTTGGEVFDTVNGKSSLPLDKAISIKSKNVDLQKNAKVDVSAGGDMFAYEWVPGIGGTKDILAEPNMYAIIPTLGQDYAPVDQVYSGSSAPVGVGQSLYLSGVAGLATGNYTLLPARYALVPGALLVEANVPNNTLLPGQTAPQIDGSKLSTGYFTDISTGARDANWSTFKITDGAIFRPAPDTISKAPSQYLLTSATKFFSNPFKTEGQDVSLPIDVARLSLDATKLNLESTVIANKQAGGDGLKVDISSAKMRVVNALDIADTDSLQLTVANLNNLSAESILLGGSRNVEQGTTKIDTTADTVSIENNAANTINKPELIVAAKQNITVKNGAVIDTGAAAAKPNKTILKNNGEGALLAVSSINDISYSRKVDSPTASNGELNIEAGSTLKAARSVVLDATKSASLAGNVSLQDGGSATFGANRILIGDAPLSVVGLNVNDAALAALGQLKALTLNSYNNIDTFGSVNFGNANLDLTMNAAGIIGQLAAGELAAPASANPTIITAKNFTLKNTQNAQPTAPADDSGRALVINANNVKFDGAESGENKVTIDGFTQANINANEIRVAKQGEVNFNVAETTLSTGRIAADSGANYQLKSNEKLTIAPLVNASLNTDKSVGAKLSIDAKDLAVAGNVDLSSGQLSLSSTNDLNVTNGAKISAASSPSQFYNVTEYAPAGSVFLSSSLGNVNVGAGALIDVTSQDKAYAGLVKVVATQGTANISGELKGAAAGTGKGGVLDVDVSTLSDLTATNSRATGFDEGRQYRVRTGDINITGTNALKAREILIAADAGRVTVSGDINATAPKNSRIDLYGDNGVSLASTANLMANSTKVGEEGGKVNIGTTSKALDNTPDKLNFATGSTIDVSGGLGGNGGEVNIIAPRTLDNTDVEIAQLSTNFIGLKDKVKIVANQVNNTSSITSASITAASNSTDSFMLSAIIDPSKGLQRLGLTTDSNVSITPGVEFRNEMGSLTFANDVSLHNWRYDPTTGAKVTDIFQLSTGKNTAGETLLAGALSIRAKDNITFSGTLSDGFSSSSLTLLSASPTPAVAAIPEVPAVLDADGEVITAAIPEVPAIPAQPATGVIGLDSWSYNIVAGADFNAANPLMTVAAAKDTTGKAITGNVNVANNKGTRTGNGDINIAAGGDLNMLGTGSVIYTAGHQADSLAGFDLPGTTLRPLYLTDGGDVSVVTQGNIAGAESQTNGRQLINQWLFRQGGGTQNRDTSWWVRPDLFRQSLATLGGGDININSGGNVSNFSASAPTTARFDTNGNSGNQVINGGGDLTVKAAGDINNGVYFVAKGDGELIAGENIQKQGSFGTVLVLQDGSFKVNAGKNALIESTINPTLVNQSLGNATLLDKLGSNAYFNTYASTASVNVTGLNGNVVYGGVGNISANVAGLSSAASETLIYAPAQLGMFAHNGDVTLADTVLMPSPTGDLKVLASGNVELGNIVMSDAEITNLPSIDRPVNQSFIGAGEGKLGGAMLEHAPQLLHKNNSESNLIVAQNANIDSTSATKVILTKATKFIAGKDINNKDNNNLELSLQNNNTSDISLIKAGKDVSVGNATLAGPGELLVQAGRNIDLSNTKSDITTTGRVGNSSPAFNGFAKPNTALPTEGASITLQAGLGDGANVQAYVDRYILPTGSGPATITGNDTRLAEYRTNTSKNLTEYMCKKTGNNALSDAEALSQFISADIETKSIFANRHLSTELVESAKDFAKAGNHNRGNNAIASLFPTLNQGDILLFASKVSTNSGGSIDMVAPGGLINVGAAGIAFKNPDSSTGDIGVITEKGGAIRAIADKDFQVNQSKVITQFGSDITIWSTTGTIDAGRGSKTATSIPERIVQTDVDGNTIVEVRGVAAGSGIRAQSYDPDGPNGPQSEPLKGKVTLIAPIVDAGEAGIEAGDLFIVAPIVLNAANIQVQGASAGVPLAAAAGVAGAGVSTTPDAVNAATQAVTQSLSQASTQAFTKPKLPSIINVEILE